MAQVKYTIYETPENTITGNENYSSGDLLLVDKYVINNTFNPDKHTVEFHSFVPDGTPVFSDYNYSGYTYSINNQSIGKSGASTLSLNPVVDIENYGIGGQDLVILYNYINDLFTEDKQTKSFFVKSISKDRTELRLLQAEPDNTDLEKYVNIIQSNLNDTSYLKDFRLNFFNNDLFIGINIDIEEFEDSTAILVKLYEPLPEIYDTNSILSIVELVADPTTFNVEAEILEEEIKTPTLKGPNFNIDLDQEVINPSQYYNISELFSYPVTSSYNQITSLFAEKSIEVNTDYSDFSSFINFSSIEERLRNFKYKLSLLESAEAELQTINDSGYVSAGITGSKTTLENTITNILSNFDHYDRYLYYESSSKSWPKSNTTRPFINYPTTSSTAQNWFTEHIASASLFDSSNIHSLENSIPSYLREDSNNASYLLFIYMIGQHFDNIWIYSKAVSEKYNADNRLTRGISKDLVQDALKNFGVNLYSSNKSLQDLFKTFTGELYELTEAEFGDRINDATLISASINPISEDLYRKEVYKRIYHNLPLIIKSKGTERGLRALVNCFGIPTSGSNALTINTSGGRNNSTLPYISPAYQVSSSLDKIRTSNTGSLVTGSTLSYYTSIQKPSTDYSLDLHSVDIGFSPQSNVDEYIKDNITGSFNIDQYIGDPGLEFSSSYNSIISEATSILGSLNKYDLNDYVRLMKFYDNVVFKMIKDFVPGRAGISTGVIIKPHLLERNKQKQVEPTSVYPGYDSSGFLNISGSINVGEYTGTHGGTFNSGSGEYTSSYVDTIIAPYGIDTTYSHNHEEAKFNGELSGSRILVSTGELNIQNTYKYDNPTNVTFKYTFFNILDPTPTPSPTPFPATATPTPTNAPSATPTGTPIAPTATPAPTSTPLGIQYGFNSLSIPGTAVGTGYVVWSGFSSYAISFVEALTGVSNPSAGTNYLVNKSQGLVYSSSTTYLNTISFNYGSSFAKWVHDGSNTTVTLTSVATPSTPLSGYDDFYYNFS